MFLYIKWGFFAILMLLALYLMWKIAVSDMRRRIIPDAYLFPLMIIGLITALYYPLVCDTGTAIIGMAFGYIMASVTGVIFDRILTKRNPKSETPIGMGDIKLIGVGGAWLGPMGLAGALIVACISGAIWAHKKHQKFIPFAPFFIFGGFLSWLAMAILI